MENNLTIGIEKILRKAIDDENISIVELSHRSRVHEGTIRRILNGANYSRNTMRRLAKALGRKYTGNLEEAA